MMAKKQNFLIALFSLLLVLALGYIAAYVLYFYELTQQTFVLTYNLLEYFAALPLAFFSAAALLCLLLRKKGVLRLQRPAQKVLLGIALVLFALYLVCLCGYLLGSWPMSFALMFLTQNAYLFLIPGALFALGLPD